MDTTTDTASFCFPIQVCLQADLAVNLQYNRISNRYYTLILILGIWKITALLTKCIFQYHYLADRQHILIILKQTMLFIDVTAIIASEIRYCYWSIRPDTAICLIILYALTVR